ncbi:MDR family oxidoreductase [Agaribacterium sp. ZY112]|uniref:acrylyl-CoA reductase (NADPH) n=1 Tax=Agaribacterium sp. ZY112 TaxID=3233574 RepID=UPI003526BB4C
MYKAIQVKQKGPKSCALVNLKERELEENEVRVAISYSTLNYKDALAITGTAPILKNYPMVPGIDLVGTVTETRSELYQVDDAVLLNGWGVGERCDGGLAEQACIQADSLIPLPQGISAKDSMSLGTAGYTAMLCIQALEEHGIEVGQKILVSGASGGVGSIATYILAKRGYHVVASTGKIADSQFLFDLGAAEIIDRNELSQAAKPLQKERWHAAIDVAGSHTLVNICASLHYGGAVAACGLAQGMDFPATVAPFILRGISLLGIDSVYQKKDKRIKAWQALAQEIEPELLEKITTEVSLNDCIEQSEQLLGGKIKGRVVVKLSS